ncbi:MAG: hypothetical protein WBV90_19240 [Terrimicrobiaceae bacterium]
MLQRFDLPPFLKAKPSDPTRAAYIAKHGDDAVYELDALTPQQLHIPEQSGCLIDVADQWNRSRLISGRQRIPAG